MPADWDRFTRDRVLHNADWYFQNWGLFAYSFKKSADLLYEEFKRTRREPCWFPAVFLYRQWLELALKSLWAEIERLDTSFEKVPWTHSLVELWSPLRVWLVDKQFFSDGDVFVASAERIFSILDSIDPKGTAFRYPQTTLPHPDVINFSLEHFERAIDQVDTVFVGTNAMMGEYEEFRSVLHRSSRT